MAKPVKFTDREKAWCRRQKPQRSYQTRPQRQRMLIVCEGEKTEPNYFKSIIAKFPPHLADIIDIQGLGANTQSLVDCAKKRRDAKADSDYSYDETWVVFARDSFLPALFDNAIHSAEGAGMEVAWSNEAFEIWYLLHFEDRQTGMHREAYKKRLTQHLGEPYAKNDAEMYRKLQEKGSEALAVSRAKQRESAHVGVPPHQANPCTTVFKLIEKLNTFVSQK